MEKKFRNPLISEKVYKKLPNVLKSVTEKFSGREKDIVLTSSLGVLSSLLPNVYGYYGSDVVYPNLYTVILAPPASGKGVMMKSKILVDEVHSMIYKESQNLWNATMENDKSEDDDKKAKKDKEKAIFLATQARDEAPHYQHSITGYNYRMSNILAGIGRAQMNVLEERVEARRRINQFYINIFKNIGGVEVFSEPSSDFYSNHWLTAIVIDASKTGKSSEGLRLALQEENIESRPLWKPLHLQPIFSDALYFGSHISEDLFDKGLCLPSGSSLSNSQLERIEKVIIKYFNKI